MKTFKTERSRIDAMENVSNIRLMMIENKYKKHIRMAKRASDLFKKIGPVSWMFQFKQFSSMCLPCCGSGVMDNGQRCFCVITHHRGRVYDFI